MTMGRERITRLLGELRAGRGEVLPELVEGVLAELKEMAHGALRRERAHALQTTELVNEAWLRLAGGQALDFECRAHFFQAAATAMRRVLVDAARRRKAIKRGAGAEPLPTGLAELAALAPALADDDWNDVEALHDALARMEREPVFATKGRVVELRFFAGLTIEQTAEVMGCSPATVKRDWEFCRSWLAREMGRARG